MKNAGFIIESCFEFRLSADKYLETVYLSLRYVEDY